MWAWWWWQRELLQASLNLCWCHSGGLKDSDMSDPRAPKTLSWPPPCWPQPCLSSLKPFGLWVAFVNTSDAIWCGETPGLILPRPFREHLWQRLKSCSVLSSFCSLKYHTGAPRLLRRSTLIHIYADSCARQNEYFHICMHKITLKVYTLQSETFSLGEVGIISRHLKINTCCC